MVAVLVIAPGLTYGQWNAEALKLAQVMEKVSRFYVDTIDESAVVERTIVQMLHELDPHSSYLSKEELEALNEQLEGEFEGIGVSFNILEDTIYIVRAISGGPSERVGITAGDRIVKVENEIVAGTGITTRDVQRLLKGAKGTRVNVSVKRRNKKELLEFNITRDKIPVFSLDASYMVNDRIGYLKLARFSHTTIEEFEKAVKALKSKGMEDLIIDLSRNGGGWLPVAVDLADHLLSGDKEIVSTEGSRVPNRKYKARKSGLFEEGNLVIMMDGGSASASEIVSGAVQDWDRGIIVGRRSFGKGLVQQPFMLSDGSLIRLTVARYYTPTGRLIQKPYEEGYEEYAMDFINRYNQGELSSADSIVFPPSQRYSTLTMNRTVYGGGGIQPDIEIKKPTTTETTKILLNSDAFFNYATSYFYTHKSIVAASDFKLRNTDFSSLVNYLKNHHNYFETKTEVEFNKAKQKAATENLDGNLSKSYASLLEDIRDEKLKELEKNKQEILEKLTEEIVKRYYFNEGMYQQKTVFDTTILKAVSVLNNSNEYNGTLSTGENH